MGTASLQNSLTQPLISNAAVADFAVEYGIPGKPGYAYHRPFDYFDLQFTSSTATRFENIFTRGLLAGRGVRRGSGPLARGLGTLWQLRLRGAADLQGVERRAVARNDGAAESRRVERDSEPTLLAGVGYGAGGGLNSPDSTDYHYGLTPQVLGSMRFIPGDRAAVDLTFRDYYVSRYASSRAGSENIARAERWSRSDSRTTMRRRSDTSGPGAPPTGATRCQAE